MALRRSFFIDPRRGRVRDAKPDAEVVYSYFINKKQPPLALPYLAGWYWRCIGKDGAPEGGVNGPWPSKEAAIRACREEFGTDMVEYLERYDGRTDLWRERLV